MTRTCPSCGAPADETESFCGECGTYLEWEDQAPVPAHARPEPGDEPAPDPGTETAGTEASGAATGAESARTPKKESEQRTGQEPEPDTKPDTKPVADPVSQRAPARGTADDPGGATAVAPRRPQAAMPRSHPRARPRTEEPLRPGDLICGSCGAGNTPTRKFCRRCGHDLVEAEVVHVPWWRRIFTRRRRVHVAGSRPPSRTGRRGQHSSVRRLGGLAVVLLLLAGGGYAARGWLGDTGAMVMDRIASPTGAEAESVTATSAAPGHPASAINDTDPTQFWAPAGDARGQSVTARFAEPQRLVHLLISPGASVSKKGEWVAVGRPRTIELVLRRTEDRTERRRVELPNEMGEVQVDLGVGDVTAVTLRLTRTYPGRSQELVAVGEVEFFVR